MIAGRAGRRRMLTCTSSILNSPITTHSLTHHSAEQALRPSQDLATLWQRVQPNRRREAKGSPKTHTAWFCSSHQRPQPTMSKKGGWTRSSISGALEPISNGSNGGLDSPQLFSRRFSKAQPFVIHEQNDSPYEKHRNASIHAEHLSSARVNGHAKTLSSIPGVTATSSLIGLGIYRSPKSTTGVTVRVSKRSKRILSGLFILFVFVFWKLGDEAPSTGKATSTSSYSHLLPSPPSAAGLAARAPLSLKRLFSSRSARSAKQSREEDLSTSPHGGHTFHPNGLLLVNPKGRHPINVLIENAEKKWSTLLKKQSTTLDEATQEYKRRYKRNPPKGWEAWWKFAKDNKVILTDEYDQIARDLAPYFALEPHDLRHRNKVMQEREHTFTLSIKDGHVTRHGPHPELRRAKDMQNLMQKFAQYVPGEINMTYIIDDQPAVMLPWNQKERMLELASQGEFWSASEFVEPEDPNLSNFAQACPPNSAFRQSEESGTVSRYGSVNGGRSFVHDVSKAVDICSHPEFKKLHGYTDTSSLGLTPLVPLFTWAKTNMQSDILVTPLEQYDDDYLVYDPPFEYKLKNKLLWRGSTTGTEFRKDFNWEQSQRARLHFMGNKHDGNSEFMWSNQGAMVLQNSSNKIINDKFMDVSFSGVPAQCDEETCEIMSKTIDFAPTMGLEDQNQYRYLMDVDGNGWSGRFHRLLSTNGVVLKSTIFPEWYQERIIPWVHYVPIKVDYTDLYDVMAFFIGNPETGEGSHESMAQRIAEQGKQFAKEHWRRADMAAYMFRLILEYNRLLNQDSEDVDYISEEF